LKAKNTTGKITSENKKKKWASDESQKTLNTVEHEVVVAKS
jgi:hypothetical protein